jgi:uncharacterized protein RhaS with RHS repeats
MHRYYDPDTGRYLTPDPIGLAGGINPFVYSENNPINLIDPYGLWTLAIDFSVTAGAGKGATAGHTYVIDSNLNIARIEHAGEGGYGGVGAGAAAQFQITNAPTVYDLAGGSMSMGGSLGAGAHGTAEIVIMDNGYYGFNAGMAGGPGTPIELHGLYEISNVTWDKNLFNVAFEWLKNKLSKQDNPCK